MSWIKVRNNLPDDPRVRVMASELRVSRAQVVGALVIVWQYADEHSTDGALRWTTPAMLDEMTGTPGMSAAMIRVGWLDDTAEGVAIPRFATHNGQTAKARAQGAARTARSRNGGPLHGCNGSALQGGNGGPSPEKSREEKRRERERARDAREGGPL